MRRLHFLSPWLVLVFYWLLLCIATHIPRLPQINIAGRDKTMHFTAYMGLTILFWLACWGKQRPHWLKRGIYVTVLLVACYAALDEITQEYLIQGRTGDPYDWLADMSGCITGLLLLYLLRSWRRWLIVYWGALFFITHFPGQPFFRYLPPEIRQFHALGVMLSYLVLTFLWWRSLSKKPYFTASLKIFLLSVIILPAYVLVDVLVAHLMHRGIDRTNVYGAIMGIGLGLLCSVTLSLHNVHNQYISDKREIQQESNSQQLPYQEPDSHDI